MLTLCLVLLFGCALSEEFDEIPQLRITLQPVGGVVATGDRFDFNCRAETSSDKTVSYTWKRIKELDSLTPVFETLPTDETGSEGEYIVYTAEESAFYFCVVTSDAFQTVSHGAHLEVAYVDEFAADGGPAAAVYDGSSILMIELQCQVPESNPRPNVRWYKQEVAYAAENAILKRDETGEAANLVIFDLTVDDSGKYHCEVENEGAGVTRVSDSAYIEIKPAAATVGAWSPQTVVDNYDVQGVEGKTMILHAGVASKPIAEYAWAFNGEDILDGGRFSKEDFGRSLIISELSVEDEGTYIITHSQEGMDKGTTNINLEVVKMVSSIGDVADFSTVKGEGIELDCGCSGSPPDWILYDTDTPGNQWFKNGALLTSSASVAVETTANGKNTGKVVIKSASDAESGTYSCSCFNQETYLTFTKNVYIADERQALTVSAAKEGWGLVGTTVSIACTAEGIPRPSIDWFKGGNKVVEGVFPRSDGFKIVYENNMFTSTGYLVVEGGLHDDSGVFECMAHYSVAGVEYNLTTTSDLIIAKPTSSRIQCLDTIVQDGTKATIVCGVSGVPLPTVTYTKVNVTDSSLIQLLPEFGQVLNTSYFVINEVSLSDAGTYRGDATNVRDGGLMGRYATMTLSVTPSSSQMSMNMIIGMSVLVAFLLLGGLIVIILLGRWRREAAFNAQMERLIGERDAEVHDLQQRLQLRSMEHITPSSGNPLHQLPETRRQLPSFYAANIAVLAATPSAKVLPPSLADLKKRRLNTAGATIPEAMSLSRGSVKTSPYGFSDGYADDN